MNKTYLGDGLYAQYDGEMLILRAPREYGEHYVALEPMVLQNLFSFIEKQYKLKITIEKQGEPNEKTT